jgi:hypothetical protein
VDHLSIPRTGRGLPTLWFTGYGTTLVLLPPQVGPARWEFFRLREGRQVGRGRGSARFCRSQVGLDSAGALKKSARHDRAAHESLGKSQRMVATDERPASASVTLAAGGPPAVT